MGMSWEQQEMPQPELLHRSDVIQSSSSISTPWLGSLLGSSRGFRL